jgi:hypothetical protein
MTEPTAQVFPLTEIWSAFSQIGGTFATGMSALPAKLSQAITNGVIDFNKVAATLGEDFRYYALKTLEFSERAALAGRPAETQIFREWSETFARQANGFLKQAMGSGLALQHIN